MTPWNRDATDQDYLRAAREGLERPCRVCGEPTTNADGFCSDACYREYAWGEEAEEDDDEEDEGLDEP